MRLVTRLKYDCLRYLGVVSPSGRYPFPPRWALSKLGKHRFYDAPGCELACCKPQTACTPRCPICNDPADLAAVDRENGREKGAQR